MRKLLNLFKRTPDQELAKAVRDAADAYNAAVLAAKKVGLRVDSEMKYASSYSIRGEWAGDKVFTRVEVRRNTSTSL